MTDTSSAHSEYSLKLAQAVQTADLDQVAALLPDTFHAPQHTVRSTLKWIFEAAQRDGIDLLHPPKIFMPGWAPPSPKRAAARIPPKPTPSAPA